MRRKVLLVQPSMQPPGGGNGVAAWMLQALVDHHDVTVLTWWRVELDEINRYFGTSLRAGSFQRLQVPSNWRRVPDHLPVPASLLRNALLMRYTRRVSHPFDVILGAHNEVDYGRRGIQYVHYPTYLRPRPEVDLRWYHRFTPALNAYYTIADAAAGFSLDRMKSNLTLVNSNWTGAQLHRLLGITAQTLYPPVAAQPPQVAWEERRHGFLALGRISPEKLYERMMRIVARVREKQRDVSLTIVGTYDRATQGYYDELQTLAASLDPDRTWISFRQNVTRREVQQLMATYRYGIHGMLEEHFGMAPAEMVRSGMIVWVPNGGGQVEIVGNNPAVTYESEEEAADKIVHVMRDQALQRRLRYYLSEHGNSFAIDKFVTTVREIVSNFQQ